MREPLLVPVAALSTGIVVARIVEPATGSLVAVLGVLGALLLAVSAWRGDLRGFRRALGVGAALAIVAVIAMLVDRWQQPGPRPFIDAPYSETVLVSGCVVEAPILSGSSYRLVVELDRGARARATLYLDSGETPPRLAYGQRVDLTGRIRQPHNFQDPGAFDYVGYLERRHVYWTISITDPAAIHVLPGHCGSLLPGVIQSIRAAAFGRLDTVFSSRPQTDAMFRAILLGDQSSLERGWQDQYRRTGTYHTLVISGLHLAVLTGCLLLLLRIFALPKDAAVAVTCVVAWLYAGVTGWNTPVLRAAAGLTLYLAASYFYRRARLLNVLAGIAIVFLLADTDQLFDPSFHLSFLAVAAIGAFALPAIEATTGPYAIALRGLRDSERGLRQPPRSASIRLELYLLAETVRHWTRIPDRWSLAAMAAMGRAAIYTADLAIVSAVIQMVLLLPMVVYFHRFSVVGLVANPVMVFLTTLAVPAGFAAMLTGAPPLVAMSGWLIAVSRQATLLLAAWEPGWRIPAPPGWLLALFLGSLLAAGISLRVARRIRLPAIGLFAVSALLLLLHPFAADLRKGLLEITVIDVGQGDSIFLAFPDGTRMLVDGGGIPVFPGRDAPRLEIGEDIVSPYLWSRSITSVDIIAATHAHEDHIGGLPAIMENFRPRELWMAGPESDQSWQPLVEAARQHGLKVVQARAGAEWVFGGARVTALFPPLNETFQEPNLNNDSLVLRVSYGRRSVLLAGDIEGAIERSLAASAPPTDVIKVAHHGSKTSTTDQLLAALHPSQAIISAGFQNIYGFPHPDVISRLDSRDITTWRTDRNGLVSVFTDGEDLWVEHWQDQPTWYDRESVFPNAGW